MSGRAFFASSFDLAHYPDAGVGRGVRPPAFTEVIRMNVLYVVGAVVSALLFVYLVYALIKAEDF
jgi:K+-transporting ATPase KdpF subunit